MRQAAEVGSDRGEGAAKARVYQTAEERDADLENNYRYREHDQWESTLAFVWVHAEELRDEFFAWWEKCGGDWGEQLAYWEVKRFGNRLEPAAHAVLRWRVIRNIDGIRKRGREPRVLYESVTERLTWEHAVEVTPAEAFEEGDGAAVKARNDTRTIRRLTRVVARATEDRLALLRAQAGRIQA